MGKKGGSSSNTQTYTPTAEEKAMQQQALEYSKYVMPNAKKLNDVAGNMLYNSLGDTQVDYNQLMKTLLVKSSGDKMALEVWHKVRFQPPIKRRWKTLLRAALITPWAIFCRIWGLEASLIAP